MSHKLYLVVGDQLQVRLLGRSFSSLFFLLELILVLLQEPGLHIGIGASLNLRELLHLIEFLVSFAVLAIASDDVVFHVLICQVAIGLLAFLLLDLAQFDGEVRIFATNLNQSSVFRGVQDAGSLGKLLGQDDLGVDLRWLSEAGSAIRMTNGISRIQSMQGLPMARRLRSLFGMKMLHPCGGKHLHWSCAQHGIYN